MKMLLPVLFPKALDPQAHEAFEQLADEGVADASFEHVCAYDGLEQTPNFHRSGIILYTLTGATLLACIGAGVGYMIASTNIGHMPTDTGALLGFLGFGTLGGFASALGGIGAPDPGLQMAARNLGKGRMLMTFALTESRLAPKAERILESFGALEIHRQLR